LESDWSIVLATRIGHDFKLHHVSSMWMLCTLHQDVMMD